ncbi:hypothetical protein QE152_g9753 [Popillia japonica]|uniref:Uncharacterized protein n=1 Tax=Popillia japonica TaxID=7064 RepID=A0AAW1LXM3_POPJA
MLEDRMYNLNNPSDIDLIERFLCDEDDPTQTEDFLDEPDTDSEEGLEKERLGNSESEEMGTDEEPDLGDNLFYLRKDKFTKWMKYTRPKKRSTVGYS